MRATARRVSRLEARAAPASPSFTVLLHLEGTDGKTAQILTPDGEGGWRPATAAEVGGPRAVLNEGDLELL